MTNACFHFWKKQKVLIFIFLHSTVGFSADVKIGFIWFLFIVLKVVGRSREVKDGQIVGHQGVFTIQYFTGGRFEQKRTYRLGRICRNDAPRTTYHQSGSIVKNFFLWNQQLPVKLLYKIVVTHEYVQNIFVLYFFIIWKQAQIGQINH